MAGLQDDIKMDVKDVTNVYVAKGKSLQKWATDEYSVILFHRACSM